MEDLLDRIALLVRSRYPLLALLTHEEERAGRLVRRLAREQGWQAWSWRLSEGLGPVGDAPLADTREPAAALSRVAGIEEAGLFLFHDLHRHLGDPLVVRLLRDLEPRLGARCQALVAVGPVLAVPCELEKDMLVLDLPLPGEREVRRLLRAVLHGRRVELEEAMLERFVRASLGLTEKEIKRCYARIVHGGARFDEGDLEALAESKRQAIRRSRFLEMHEPEASMDDVGGLANLKAWLGRRSAAFGEAARRYGLPEPRGLFLLGVQGCGKSLTAKAVARLFHMPLLRLDVGELFRAGAQEESLRHAILVAESVAPCVLWIDEIEKAFEGGRTGSELATLLTWMQEKKRPVFVVATANEVRVLPPELLRKGRFDEIFFVDLPDVHDRLEILEIHLRRRGRDPEAFDLMACAEETEKYSGAELEQVIVEAMFDAFAEGREVTARDLLRVVRSTVPLAITMDDRLKELREWARPRTRPAAVSRRRVDFFDDFVEA